jgi:hypothetical protein
MDEIGIARQIRETLLHRLSTKSAVDFFLILGEINPNKLLILESEKDCEAH